MASSIHKPLMAKSTAMWLIENTILTFEQISESCGLDILEVQALADDESPGAIKGENPLINGQLTQEELDRCSHDPQARLHFQPFPDFIGSLKKKEGHYIPRSKRQDRPDGIAWILKNYPKMSDNQICQLLHTTPKTIQTIRDRTHHNTTNIKPRNPVSLGLCSDDDLKLMVDKIKDEFKEEGI